MKNEAEFAYRVRQALDEGAGRLDYKVVLRLEKARRAAVERGQAREAAPVWVPALQLATAGGAKGSGFSAWIFRLGLAAPVFALALGIVGIKQWQNDRTVAEVADLDFAVLLDDTPIETYAHQGFGQYLQNENNM
jgi:hypothetical protein